MTRGVLDTSVLVSDVVSPLPGTLAISVISLAELHVGVLVAKDDVARAARLSRLSALSRRFDAPLPVDEAAGECYGRLAARVVAVGRRPRRRAMDLLVAAMAMAHEAVLYTRNPDDLVGLDDLVTVVEI